MGLAVHLSCSAAGHAWLLTMKEDDALRLVYAQGFGSPERFGPRAPQTARELLGYIEAARARRYAMIVEQFAPGMSSMSVPIIGRDDVAMGVLTIAGPTFRLTETRMAELSGPLIDAARTVSRTSSASALFRQPPDTLA
jgi:DNA-binding IclR family transcriptional regulator